ncbi:MAG: hypothetical protein ACI9KE_000758 [Polyangiales bacterium]
MTADPEEPVSQRRYEDGHQGSAGDETQFLNDVDNEEPDVHGGTLAVVLEEASDPELVPPGVETPESTAEEKRRFAFLSIVVDFSIAALAAPLTTMLVADFQAPSVFNGVWPALAFVGFTWSLAIIPRLSHDAGSQPVLEGTAVKPTARTQWVFLSIMLGTLTFLIAVPLVTGSALEPLRDWYLESLLAKLLALPMSLVVIAIMFLPFYFYLQPNRHPVHPKRVVPVEVAIVLVCDLVAIVGVALWEWLGESARTFEGEPSLAFYPGMLIMVPLFLFIFGGPRIVLLNRRFSWGAALSLFLSTAWYLAHDFVS